MLFSGVGTIFYALVVFALLRLESELFSAFVRAYDSHSFSSSFFWALF